MMATSLSFDDLVDFYNRTMDQADARCDEFPLLRSPDKMLAAVFLYLFIVWQGPKWMKNYEAFDLKKVIVVYNFAMVLLSSYTSLGVVYGIYKAGGYSIFCDPLDKYEKTANNETEYYYVFIGWVFFLSKIIEFWDTFFFILRKKTSQITFLHVYHHATMTVFTWLGVKFAPGGANVVYPLINSFIHAVMYTYYGLAACGPSMRKYLWWKRYLTRMQISQFVIFMTQGVLNVVYDCKFPKVFVCAVYIYTCTILILFINFYVRAYIMKSSSPKAAKTENGAESVTHANGKHVQNGHTAYAENGGLVKNGNAKKVN